MARFIEKFLGLPEERRQEYESKQAGGHKALAVMEQQLSQTAYLVGDSLTTAGISLYGYTHVAHEGGFNLSEYPAVNDWLIRIAARQNYINMSSQ